MARRARPVETDAHEDAGLPRWLLTYVQSEWEHPDDAEKVAAMARDWGSEAFARRICADNRHSAARRAWADAHGITLKELAALVGPVSRQCPPRA